MARQFNIRLTDEDARLLESLAARYGLDPTGLTRMAWRFLEEHGPIPRRESKEVDATDGD
jgi:hypothetical protein